MNWKTTAAGALLVTAGCLQMAGDVFGIVPLKAIGAASGVSPAPKVFTAHDGFETYSNRVVVSWRDAETGAQERAVLDRSRYAGLAGPYNRRNAYGAAIVYAPILSARPETAGMVTAVHRHALCADRPVLAELGLDGAVAAGAMAFELEPLHRAPEDGLAADVVARATGSTDDNPAARPRQRVFTVRCDGGA